MVEVRENLVCSCFGILRQEWRDYLVYTRLCVMRNGVRYSLVCTRLSVLKDGLTELVYIIFVVPKDCRVDGPI